MDHGDVALHMSRGPARHIEPYSEPELQFSAINLGSAVREITLFPSALTALTLSSTIPKSLLSDAEKTLALKIHALLVHRGRLKPKIISIVLADVHSGLETSTVDRVLDAYQDVHFLKERDKPYWIAIGEVFTLTGSWWA